MTFVRARSFPPVEMAAGVVRVSADAHRRQRLGSEHIGAAAATAKRNARRSATGLAVMDLCGLLESGWPGEPQAAGGGQLGFACVESRVTVASSSTSRR